jgi:hypothetical protein
VNRESNYNAALGVWWRECQRSISISRADLIVKFRRTLLIGIQYERAAVVIPRPDTIGPICTGEKILVFAARFGDAHLSEPQFLSYNIACVPKVRAVPFVRVFRLSRDLVMILVDRLVQEDVAHEEQSPFRVTVVRSRRHGSPLDAQ